jgi:helicase
MTPIPVLEIKQMMGRAGRPGYDKEGEAILMAKNKGEIERLWSQYIIADVEPIYSKLGSEPALRMHLLALIATNLVTHIEELYQFMAGTFFVYQSGYLPEDKIQEILHFLKENEFITCEGDYFKATNFGRKTSDLYIDPLSALKLRTALESKMKPTIFSFLHAISTTPDMICLYLRSSDSSWIMEKAEKEHFLFENGDYSTLMNEWFLSEVKTASLIEDWINEVTEDQIVLKYNVGPGDIHNKIETATWLLHAMRELARMFNFEVVSLLDKLNIRVKNGCKEELLNLIQLRDIGRVRGRALYKAGFKTINQLRNVNIKTLSKIPTIGERVAKTIKEQLGEPNGNKNNGLYRKYQ